MFTDARRLGIGIFAVVTNVFTETSLDRWIKLLGLVVSSITVIYLILCCVQKYHEIKSGSRIEPHHKGDDDSI